MDANDLSNRFTLDGLTIEAGRGGLTRLKLETDLCSSEIYLQGAHLTHFQPRGNAPVLWMSESSFYEQGKPIRGGVPICFPWFGPHANDAQSPSHGWARLTPWNLLQCQMGSKGEVILTLGCSLAGFQVKYSLTLSTILRMAMTVELDANASNGQAFESALHTYLRIEDIHRVSVEGLEGTAYLDKVGTSAQRPASQFPIRFQGETDRVYGDTEATCFLNDPGMNRRIRVSKTGSRSTVIWNPWIDKSRRMQDFGDQEWQTMVCIETANIGSNAISLEPGEMHTMTADLEVLPSADAR